MDVLALVGAVWAAGYAIVCCVWPYGPCRKCDGAGKFGSPSRKFWRPCPRCGGKGRRIRAGRYIVEWFRWGGERERP